MIFCRALLLFWVVLLVPFASHVHANQCDIYALHSAVHRFDSSVIEPTFVKGVAVQIGWSMIEPSNNKYHWQQIDELLASAKALDKKVVLHVLPLRPPQWLFDLGAEPFEFSVSNRKNPRYGKTRKEVLPWDPIYLQQWQDLVEQLGRRYGKNTALFGISVTAPSPEMVLPGGIPRNKAYPRIKALYDEKVYRKAWEKMIDAYQEAFPGKAKFLAPGVVLRDEHFADQVLEYAHQRFGRQLWVFNAGLHAQGTAVGSLGRGHVENLLREYAKKTNLGLQMIWSASNDPHQRLRGSLSDAIAQGVALGAGYLEIYERDLRHPGLNKEVFQTWEKACGKTAQSAGSNFSVPILSHNSRT